MITADLVLELSDLLQVAGGLHARELRVLRRIAKRLKAGQELYGPLYKGKRVWRSEAQEEAFDMAVYLSVKLEDDGEPP